MTSGHILKERMGSDQGAAKNSAKYTPEAGAKRRKNGKGKGPCKDIQS